MVAWTSTAVSRVSARTYTIPTDAPESDGTAAWNKTTMVTAEVEAGGKTGFGYTYCDGSARAIIERVLAERLGGQDALAIEACWQTMNAAVRNLGRPVSHPARSPQWTSHFGISRRSCLA